MLLGEVHASDPEVGLGAEAAVVGGAGRCGEQVRRSPAVQAGRHRHLLGGSAISAAVFRDRSPLQVRPAWIGISRRAESRTSVTGACSRFA